MQKKSRHICLFMAALLVLSFEKRAFSAEVPVSLYGFIQASWLGASSGVNSFGQPNFSAYTASSNPVLDPNYNKAQSSFQVAQSRFGLLIKPEEKILGRIEMDFIKFTLASPTTQASPRLRRAAIDYKASDQVTFRLGQDWDLIQAQGPFTYNWVGRLFQSGDIGFMRIQAMSLIQTGSFEHSIAVGLPTSNANSSNGSLETGMIPSISFREIYKPAEGVHIGAAVIGSSLLPSGKSTDHFLAGAVTLFANTKLNSWFDLVGKVYVGQNTVNLGMLGISYSNGTAPNLREAGGYLSGRAAVSDRIAIYGSLSGAWILNGSDLPPSYVTVGGTSSLNGNEVGMFYNIAAHLGTEWKVEKNLAFFIELASLHTKYQLAAADQNQFDQYRQSFVTQLGAQLNF